MASVKDRLAARRASETGGKGKSLSKSAVSEIRDATRFAEKIGSDKKFSDLAKEYKQANVKYDRPATFREAYGEEVNKVGTPLASTYYKDPVTGKERFFTAQAPTIKQLMGDVGRAFSGYNTLSYDPNAQGIATTTGGQIVRQPGLLENFGIPYISTALKIGNAVSDAWNKVRGFFSPSQTPQGIETQFPRVSPEARGYFGGYNQEIDTQIPVENDRGMNIPVSIAQPVASTPLNTGFIPEGYGGINSIPLSSGYLPEGYSYGIGSVPDYYDSNNTLGNIYLNSQGYDVPVSNNLMSSRNPSYLEQQDNYYYQNRPQSSPTGQQYYYAKNGGSVDKYAGLGYKLR